MSTRGFSRDAYYRLMFLAAFLETTLGSFSVIPYMALVVVAIVEGFFVLHHSDPFNYRFTSDVPVFDTRLKIVICIVIASFYHYICFLHRPYSYLHSLVQFLSRFFTYSSSFTCT